MNMINKLIEEGYKYLVVPKKCSVTFNATKEEPINGRFDDSAEFSEFRAETEYEKEVLKVFPKGVFINLTN